MRGSCSSHPQESPHTQDTEKNNKKSPEMGLSKRQTEYWEQGWEGMAGWQGRDEAEATEWSTGRRD